MSTSIILLRVIAWHSKAYSLTFFLTFYLTSILTLYLHFFLSGNLASFLASILRMMSLQLRSGGHHSDPAWACCSGAAGNTLILCLLFGSGGDHCDHELAVEVQRGTHWSLSCCSCPARTIAITSWEHSDPGLAALLWPGPLGHSDPVLAVRVRRGGGRGPLRSRACNWGPAGNTLILACWVRRGPLRSRACRWGPVGNTMILRLAVRVRRGAITSFSAGGEEGGRDSWH